VSLVLSGPTRLPKEVGAWQLDTCMQRTPLDLRSPEILSPEFPSLRSALALAAPLQLSQY